MMQPTIIVTEQDYDRLSELAESGDTPTHRHLGAELERARVVAQDEIPSDVVTMNSDVTYLDLGSGVERTVRLVYPGGASAERGFISILAPIGAALLGLSTGQEIDWPTPGGTRRVRVIAVHYQPERSGDFSL